MASITWPPHAHFRSYLPPQQLFTLPDTSHLLSRRKSLSLLPNNKSKTAGDNERSPVAGPSSHTAEPSTSETESKKRRISKAPSQFGSSTEMMEALAACFKPGGQAVFSGSYTIPNEPGISDKHRVQLVSHDIWRATGYRFTVKDHPPIKDGHKTRLWCSQDIQRKHKPNAKSRVLSSGEVVAKVRYCCRSRLLISSRDAELSGHRLVTVRMHHHVPHEPYSDSTTSPAVLQAMWGSPNWPAGIAPSISSTSRSGSMSNAITPATSRAGMRWESGSEDGGVGAPEEEAVEVISDTEERYITTPSEMFTSSPLTPPPHPILSNPMVTVGQLQPQLQLSSFPQMRTNSAASEPPLLDTEHFQKTMRQHIRNIRDFCDGLEYQVQFNDFRMLRELEERGGSFLSLVHDCLKREGRLGTDIDQQHRTPDSSGASDL